jgi:uncharacterized protein YndB with AHSA1/START domain
VIIVIITAAIAVPTGIVLAVGACLPVAHRARASATYSARPDAVWRTLTAFEEHPTWRRGLKEVQRVSDSEGEAVKEISAKGETMTFETTQSPAERRMVRRIADKNLPFGGSWTFEVTPNNGGSRVTITEDGEVYNIVFRFVSKFVMGHYGTIKAFLEDLSRKFGEEATVEIEDA